MPLSHFDEKSGIVPCVTPWGKWWQTVSEVSIQVEPGEQVVKKDVNVVFKPNTIECTFKGKTIFKGDLYRTVIPDESTWVIEERKVLYILLAKADPPDMEVNWLSLLKDQYAPNPMEALEMQKKLDLERFQIQNPSFDFSGAKLDKKYEQLPFS